MRPRSKAKEQYHHQAEIAFSRASLFSDPMNKSAGNLVPAAFDFSAHDG